jgi:hypothetical protein
MPFELAQYFKPKAIAVEPIACGLIEKSDQASFEREFCADDSNLALDS